MKPMCCCSLMLLKVRLLPSLGDRVTGVGWKNWEIHLAASNFLRRAFPKDAALRCWKLCLCLLEAWSQKRLRGSWLVSGQGEGVCHLKVGKLKGHTLGTACSVPRRAGLGPSRGGDVTVTLCFPSCAAEGDHAEPLHLHHHPGDQHSVVASGHQLGGHKRPRVLSQCRPAHRHCLR